MSLFLRDVHRDLPAYVPGTHEEGSAYVRLNTNESPFPPSSDVLESIARESINLNFYNDPDCTSLISALSAHVHVAPENLMVGNGSDQVLQLAFLAFADGFITLPDITYSYYDLFAALYGIKLRRIPLESDFSIDPLKYWNAGSMIVFPNPNAPTGLALTPETIQGILEHNPDQVVLIDEAYVDFGAETVIPLIDQYPNLLVVRTFSKSGSMAGIRLGYGAGSAGLIADLARIRNAVDLYGVNRLAQAAGVAACSNWTYYADNCRLIMRERARTTQELRAMGFTVLDSLGNFIFAKPAGIPASALQQALAQRGILVRHFSGPRTEEWLRISIGTAAQMSMLIDACRQILKTVV